MVSINKIKKLFWFAVAILTVMSATILVMPFSANINDRRAVVAVGLTFWVSAIVGYTLLIFANRERKKFIFNKLDRDFSMNFKIGILSFFSNIPASVADAMLIGSSFAFIVIRFTNWQSEYISYVLLFILFLSFNMHCIFNGRIYKIIKYKRIRSEKNNDLQ